MVHGVAEGYSRGLELFGTGYSVKVDGKNLVLSVGYAKPVTMPIPAGVTVTIEVAATRGNDVPARFSVGGPDKQVIGQFARTIKDSKPPEPYQGKGLRYAGEQIRRKQGKAFASGAAG
jgi:large subunit ribosomal protein L6